MKQHLSVMLVALSILLVACGQLEGDALSFRTADENLTIGVRLLPAPPAPPIAPAVLPTITPTPCELVIKGNIAADGTRIAHSPGQANYESTIVDESKGEKWFCSLEEAIAEGWRAAKN